MLHIEIYQKHNGINDTGGIGAKGASIHHWLQCIAGEAEPITHGQIGRDGIELAEATYRSSQSGVPISLPL